ncbi:MAG: family 10 glycosylhydrolase [Clostridia bacterium]|nr:family 10 glycosylhydrolase [Clostridia bacterium]
MRKHRRYKGWIAALRSLALYFLILVILCTSAFAGLLWLSSRDSVLKSGQGATEAPISSESPSPVFDREVRGVYIASVHNINFPTRSGLSSDQLQAELDAILDHCHRIGFNTLYFQVRPTGDALYASRIFPVSRYLAAAEGGALPLDPLAYLVEKATFLGIDVVAWVNPYRITSSSFPSKEAALASLSEKNPAKQHPDWTVFYGGRLYYNPALPSVSDLIAAGLREICEGYGVKGILYDDYFYPYPVSGESFGDDKAFSDLAPQGMSREDWRRENVNRMVKQSYDTVKSVSQRLSFGVSPFGIWKNASSDPEGSATRGLEAYHSLYCDALAWIRGGYVDYIAPQIYWETGYSAASFDVLVRWWSDRVDGTGVKLFVSHAAYKVEGFALGSKEITDQITLARSYRGFGGSIQYGYAAILANTRNLAGDLQDFYGS